MIGLNELVKALDTTWVLVATCLVFFMQAGFCMVENGFTRAKNAANIIMKNLMDYVVGSLMFFIIGFGLMFGDTLWGIVGVPGFFGSGSFTALRSWMNLDLATFIIWQTVFCATAATIVSGAMAERTKFSAYLIYSFCICTFIYPVVGHWIWGGGWLADLGFKDFAGSTVVHMLGGICALVGAKTIGPRIGKYDKDGTVNAIPGHSLTLGALGVFILWFGWFGFNPGSSLSGVSTGLNATIFMTTNLAAAAGAITTMFLTWIKYKKPDVSLTLNGALAGLVGITAGCNVVDMTGALIIGALSGFAVVYGISFIDRVLKIDDPVGAIGVHMLSGTLGTLAVGLFSTTDGLFYGGGINLFLIQLLGILAVALWTFVTINIVFYIIKKTVGLRVSKEEEIDGLDFHEHGLANSYPDFTTTTSHTLSPSSSTTIPTEISPTSTPIPTTACKLTKIDIITRQNKFEELKEALNEIGITGLTVYQVLGCGTQKGKTHHYRGSQVKMDLLPKVKVEICVCKVPVDLVIETAKKVLYTGAIGDGKIFVYPVENVIKVRTGEEGFDALQDD